MSKVDGLVRGMARRIPSPSPNTVVVGVSRKTGTSHTHTIPTNIQDGDICVIATTSRNSDIGAVANSSTGAAWTQDTYIDLATNEEVRIHHKFAKNESGNWTVSQSGTGASAVMVLRVTNPHLQPTLFGGWAKNNYTYSAPAMWVPKGGVYIRIHTGSAFGNVSELGSVYTQGQTFYEPAHIQQGSDECVSMWYSDVPFEKGFGSISRTMNDNGYTSASVMWVAKGP